MLAIVQETKEFDMVRHSKIPAIRQSDKKHTSHEKMLLLQLIEKAEIIPSQSKTFTNCRKLNHFMKGSRNMP